MLSTEPSIKLLMGFKTRKRCAKLTKMVMLLFLKKKKEGKIKRKQS